MNFTSRPTLFASVAALLLAGATLAVAAGTTDQAAAERAVFEMYRQYEAGFAQKDVNAIFRYFDPSWKVTTGANDSGAGLAFNRERMADALSKVRSLKVTVVPQASELVGDSFLVRYKQTHVMEFPLNPKPATTWYIAEDTWKRKNGQWRLMSTRKLDNSVSQAQRMLEAQKKQMEWQDEQRRSQRCIGGVGYGCGGYR